METENVRTMRKTQIGIIYIYIIQQSAYGQCRSTLRRCRFHGYTVICRQIAEYRQTLGANNTQRGGLFCVDGRENVQRPMANCGYGNFGIGGSHLLAAEIKDIGCCLSEIKLNGIFIVFRAPPQDKPTRIFFRSFIPCRISSGRTFKISIPLLRVSLQKEK